MSNNSCDTWLMFFIFLPLGCQQFQVLFSSYLIPSRTWAPDCHQRGYPSPQADGGIIPMGFV